MKGIVSLGVPRFESQATGPQPTNLPLVELSNEQANENSKLLAWDLGVINSKWVFPKMSASHEKSPTEKHIQDSTPQQQKHSFVSGTPKWMVYNGKPY